MAAWTQFFMVTFDTHGGSSVDAQIVEVNASVAEPDEPTRTGYTFGGWRTSPDSETDYAFDTPVTGDLTLHAAWVPEKRTVTFDANGGSVDPQSVSVDYATTVAEPTPTREGYAFVGWELDDEYFDFNTLVTDDLTLVAQWVKLCTVSFVGCGGTAPDPQTVVAGTIMEEPTSTYDDHHAFGGWYTSDEFRDEQRWDFSNPIEDDLMLYAQWTAETHTVAFVTNGGMPHPHIQTVACPDAG
ncbi:MAG: InlB B-repeat-containing protein [Atopobiaceae bacterium]|nr:InlB B-repeat-containing protein [Atopobiaceae bacterium]MBR3312515.1 InlB B-repeat-containing protein [Atopobiaceae bacterium]